MVIETFECGSEPSQEPHHRLSPPLPMLGGVRYMAGCLEVKQMN